MDSPSNTLYIAKSGSLLARSENEPPFPGKPDSKSFHKGTRIPSHNERRRSEIGWDDEIIAARKGGTPQKRSWERPLPCLEAGSGSKVIWPVCRQDWQRSSGGPTTFPRKHPATR